MSGDEMSNFVCMGNADAEKFCKSFVAYCHLLDDCVDRDKPCDAERVAGTSIDFIVQLSSNPFFVAHKAQLMGLIIQGFRAWADSNAPKYGDGITSPSVEMGCERDVIKGFYHEVVFHVAAILGGWKHLTEVTAMCREYDFEDVGKIPESTWDNRPLKYRCPICKAASPDEWETCGPCTCRHRTTVKTERIG